jgi:hypothetical protein
VQILFAPVTREQFITFRIRKLILGSKQKLCPDTTILKIRMDDQFTDVTCPFVHEASDRTNDSILVLNFQKDLMLEFRLDLFKGFV